MNPEIVRQVLVGLFAVYYLLSNIFAFILICWLSKQSKLRRPYWALGLLLNVMWLVLFTPAAFAAYVLGVPECKVNMYDWDAPSI
jgi:hypothetical protein